MSDISPRLQKLMDKVKPEFNRKLYFNKKFRDGVRKSFSRLQEVSLKAVESPHKTRTLEDAQDQLMSESFLDTAVRVTKLCDEIEEHQKFYNQRGEFVLFQKGEKFVFKMKTLRDGKIREGNLTFEKGLPSKRYIHAVLKKEVVKLDGYDKVDSGKYHLKQLNFDDCYFHLWGKKDKYFFNCVMQEASTEKLIVLKCKRV